MPDWSSGYTVFTANNTSSATNQVFLTGQNPTQYYAVQPDPVPPKARQESGLAWLDRRVREIRELA